MICGIITTISIAILGFLMLPSLWFWILWEIVAAGLVALGCAGEWYLMKMATPKDDHEAQYHRRELQFVLAVSIGVTLEFAGLAHVIPEALRLERDVKEANERIATNEVARLVLEKEVEELRRENLALLERLQPRALKAAEKLAVSNALEGIPRGRIRIDLAPDGEPVMFMNDMTNFLSGLGFTIIKPGSTHPSTLRMGLWMGSIRRQVRKMGSEK